MSGILDLTSNSQVRGVLTVSPADLPDEVLDAYSLEDDLEVDLNSWLSEWRSVRDEGSSQEKLLLKLYSKYRCAALVAASGQNFTLTQFTDGANAGQRSDTEGFQKLREHMESRASHYRAKLKDELSDVFSSRPIPVMGKASPRRNPVEEGRD